jgi:hypothetical protein
VALARRAGHAAGTNRRAADLVIDLDSTQSAQSAAVNLNTLDLTATSTYSFDLFFAERHTSDANLRMQKSIAFNNNQSPEPGSLGLAVVALGALGASARRPFELAQPEPL